MVLSFTASEKQLRPDPRFGSRLVSKFINCLMWDGKKTAATRVFYDAIDEIHRKLGDKVDMLEVFETALDHVKPAVEIQSKRVGGATYQVPVRVEPKRQVALAIRWIIEAARAKKGRPMHLKLAEELMAAFRREGDAVTKRENVHKMADANKAFAHFAH
ncbi:30S ribosomal protein S7 [bacterium]|jgi:small subunit ribosomal protein S7|nr:30S ribosomal protein S7 [bacterium]